MQIVKKAEKGMKNFGLTPGLVSVSFREHSPDEIIDAAAKCGLWCIEWGSDVHVPFDDFENAKVVFEKTRNAGLFVSSYGTYFGIDRDGLTELNRYIDTAKILHTDKMRIWPPGKPSQQIIEDGEWKCYVKKTARLAKAAAKKNITLLLECHPFTLTDDYKATLDFFEAVNQPNLKLCWQPNQYKSYEYNIESVAALKKHIANMHVFNWNKNERFPLHDGIEAWRGYLLQIDRSDFCLLLEFMHDNKITSLPQTAAALLEITEKGEVNEQYSYKRLGECF